MAVFLALADFRARTTMPPSGVDALEREAPGWIQQNLDDWGSYMIARLRKRYAITSGMANPPLAILRWQAALTTLDCYLRRGFDPNSAQDLTIKERADTARAEIKEAADSVEGLFDLPLVDGGAATGVTKGGPFVYSEQSPYTWSDNQAEAGRTEDAGG